MFELRTRKLRVYVDTSVFGGVNDEEFMEASRVFFQRVVRGDFIVLVSAITYDELSAAPEKIKELLGGIPRQALEEIQVTEEVHSLAQQYIERGVLGAAWLDDALHVAAASVGNADLILSWNFKHIVNYDRIKKFNAVNLLCGYRSLDIRSPLEVVFDEENKDI